MRETAYEVTSFSAGQDSGTRVAACLARLAALERWTTHTGGTAGGAG